MYSLIERFITNLTKEKINNFALEKKIELNDNELTFIFNFIQKNWQTIYANHGKFDIARYANNFSEENYSKIVLLYKEYLSKYANLI